MSPSRPVGGCRDDAAELAERRFDPIDRVPPAARIAIATDAFGSARTRDIDVMNASGVAITELGAIIGVGPSTLDVAHTVQRPSAHTSSTVSVWYRDHRLGRLVGHVGSAPAPISDDNHTETRARSPL